MCKCSPEIRTPYCGKGDCKWPEEKVGVREEGSMFESQYQQELPDWDDIRSMTLTKIFNQLRREFKTQTFSSTFIEHSYRALDNAPDIKHQKVVLYETIRSLCKILDHQQESLIKLNMVQPNVVIKTKDKAPKKIKCAGCDKHIQFDRYGGCSKGKHYCDNLPCLTAMSAEI